jgi:hypothetical protein
MGMVSAVGDQLAGSVPRSCIELALKCAIAEGG